jgi:hypothetical protein
MGFTMEKSIGFLERVSGHTYDTIYDLLFTTERVIALIVQHPTEVPYKFGVTELLLGGILTRQRERFDRKKSAAERLHTDQEKTFDELLAGHRFNFEILYSMVTTIEVTRGLFQTRLKIQLNSPSTTGRTVRFTLAKDQGPKALNLINLALPLKTK